MLNGFKTFAVGLGLSVVPQLIAFTSNFDFTHAFGLSPNASTLVGLVIIALRAVTSTPIFQSK
jgi:hypothetical protein